MARKSREETEKARSVVTLDDNLSGCSGSLRDLDTKIFLPFTQ